MTLNCRRLTAADLDDVKAILVATDLFPPEMLEDMAGGYLSATNADLWLVAEEDENLAGFTFVEPERMTSGTWNMLALAVLPEAQGKGVGAALVRHAEEALRNSKARLLLVETLDTVAFKPQRRFYKKQGFRRIAHIPEFYDRGFGKVTFVKNLE